MSGNSTEYGMGACLACAAVCEDGDGKYEQRRMIVTPEDINPADLNNAGTSATIIMSALF